MVLNYTILHSVSVCVCVRACLRVYVAPFRYHDAREVLHLILPPSTLSPLHAAGAVALFASVRESCDVACDEQVPKGIRSLVLK